MTVCNGTCSPTKVKYSKARIKQLLPIIEEQRKILASEISDIHKEGRLYGIRTNDNSHIIWTMESANQEKLFANGDIEAVRDAITNCMENDYYYRYEKDWG